MSFILDALRKSETDRRRTAEPILAGMPVTAERTGTPPWVWAVIAFLGVAVVALGGAWWRSISRESLSSAPIAAELPASGRGAEPANTAQGESNPVTTVSAARGAAADGRNVQSPPTQSTSAAPTGAAAATPGIVTSTATSGAGATGSGASADSFGDQPGSGPAIAGPGIDTGASARTAFAVTEGQLPTTQSAGATDRSPSQSAAAGGAPTTTSAQDDAATAGASTAGTVEPAIDLSALPTVADIEADGVTLPPLTLELHVYHPDPAKRWVYINGSRYAEGRRLEGGPTLVRIVPEGVVLNYAGRDFLLLAQ